MVTQIENTILMNIAYSRKQAIYNKSLLQDIIKKGLTASYCCKPFLLMVGAIGFEPTTSTVSR